MAGKDTVFVGGALGSVMQDLSKNQLIDLVADIAYRELGEGASDEAFLIWLQQKMNFVWLHREDQKKDLQRLHARRSKQIDEFREKMRRDGNL